MKSIHKYMSIAHIEAMSADELIAYKRLLQKRADELREEAAEWDDTFRKVLLQIHGMSLALETELEMAYLDRIESDDSDYGIVAYIH